MQEKRTDKLIRARTCEKRPRSTRCPVRKKSRGMSHFLKSVQVKLSMSSRCGICCFII